MFIASLGGGGGSDPNPNFCSEFPFFRNHKLSFNIPQTCVSVKILLNLMHTNLISRLTHATVPVSGGGVWVVLGGEKNLPKILDCDFRLIWRPKKILLQAVPK